MRTFFFDLVVQRAASMEPEAWLAAVVEPMFELFGGDVTPVVSNGTPLLMCSVEATSLTQALRRVLRRLGDAGVEVRRVEMEPGALLRPAA